MAKFAGNQKMSSAPTAHSHIDQGTFMMHIKLLNFLLKNKMGMLVYFIKSKWVQIGTYMRLYETGSRLGTFGSCLKYFIKTILTFWSRLGHLDETFSLVGLVSLTVTKLLWGEVSSCLKS